jgi:hypothetical protein
LKKWSHANALEDLDFTKVLGASPQSPSELMTVEDAKSISASLGELLVVDNADNLRPSRKGFLRFRVLLNLLKSSHSQPRFHSP